MRCVFPLSSRTIYSGVGWGEKTAMSRLVVVKSNTSTAMRRNLFSPRKSFDFGRPGMIEVFNPASRFIGLDRMDLTFLGYGD